MLGCFEAPIKRQCERPEAYTGGLEVQWGRGEVEGKAKEEEEDDRYLRECNDDHKFISQMEGKRGGRRHSL
jgi:hypothetical protein